MIIYSAASSALEAAQNLSLSPSAFHFIEEHAHAHTTRQAQRLT